MYFDNYYTIFEFNSLSVKKICVDLSSCLGLGDLLASTPTIKKLSVAYNQKINIISYHPEIFANNSNVAKTYHPNEFNIENSEFQVFKTFDPYEASLSQTSLKHNLIDIRQYHALNLGFSLTKEEMQMDYLPDPPELPNLPKNYVLIHPVENWASRSWPLVKWNELIKLLNDDGIPVVAIGKDSSELGTFNTQKPVFDVQIDNGINLCNQTNLSQCWWLIQNSMCFITMDSGLLHLAGTTTANILQLGSSINKEFRAPYRNGSQDFKYFYISGSCKLSCASNLKYGVRDWNSILGVPPLVGCLENKETFECHPSAIQVYDLFNTRIKPNETLFENKKKLFIIGTYPSTPYNENMLIECIKKLKFFDYDILLVSHFQVSNEIQKLVNYYIYDYDNSLDPIQNTPYAYFANSSFFAKIEKRGFMSTICRNIINGLNFARSKKYDLFFYMESDNLLDSFDLTKLEELLKQCVLTNKKGVLFKYIADGSDMYESLMFGGEPDFFLKNLPLPISVNDFINIDVGLTLEQHFYHHLNKHSDEIFEVESTSKNYFTKSLINKNSNCAFVEILKDITHNRLILFTANYRENNYDISFQINEESKYNLSPNSWYFIPIATEGSLIVKIYELDNIVEKQFCLDKAENITTGTIEFY